MTDETLNQYESFIRGKHQKQSTRDTYLRGIKTFLKYTGKLLNDTTPEEGGLGTPNDRI